MEIFYGRPSGVQEGTKERTIMEDEIRCPWCDDIKSIDGEEEDGIYYCCRCNKHYGLEIHSEVSYLTRKIEYVK